MLAIKEEKLLTTGEFAKLAESTKKAVRLYTDKGLIKPKKINSKRYRFYSIEQLIDLQVIMLLRRLNFSVSEIKKFLRKNASTEDLFLEKEKVLQKEVTYLQKKIQDISNFYTNLKTEGVLVKPKSVIIPSFNTYIIEKIGAYSEIYNYCFELKACFDSIPKDATYFVIFPDRKYSPKKDRLRIGVIATSRMKLKKEAELMVKQEIIPSFKALTYKHIGSPALISMLIMQLHEYMSKKKLKQNLSVPINEIEFYKNSQLNGNIDDNTMISEINIPIV